MIVFSRLAVTAPTQTQNAVSCYPLSVWCNMLILQVLSFLVLLFSPCFHFSLYELFLLALREEDVFLYRKN